MGKTAVPLVLLLMAACSRPKEGAGIKKPERTASMHAEASAPKAPPDLSKAEPLRVGGEVSAPVLISRVEPNYEGCGGAKAWGFPILEGVIDETGRVQNLHLLKPVHPCLEAAVLTAVRQWRFRPGTLRGKPVPVIYNVTVHIHYR